MSKTRAENLALLREGLTSLLESDEHGLRDRQHQAMLKLAASEGEEFYQGYFNQATGVGKTYEMATMIKAFRSAIGKQDKIIQNMKELNEEKIRINNEDIPLVITAKAAASAPSSYLNGTGDKEVDKVILDKFAELSGLQRRDSILVKSEYMKNVDDLGKLYVGNQSTVRNKIKELNGENVQVNGKDIPLIIEAKAGSTVGLFLNGIGDEDIDQAIMNRFTELSGLKPRQQDNQQITNALINKKLNESKS